MIPESLIFDIDGTLWDSRALVAQGYNIQLRREDLEHLCVDENTLKPLFGMIGRDIADILFASIPAPERYDLLLRCMEAERQHLHEDPCQVGYPGVKETLTALKEKYRLFIVSNSDRGYPELCMEKLGLTELFEGHLCFGDTGTSKGQTIRTLMERHGITSCVYIGDTQGDFEATREAGVPFVWAAYGFGTPEGYDWKAEGITDLQRLFL